MARQKVVGVHYPSDALKALPTHEQRIYLATCQLINEIGMLARQMMYAYNFGDEGELPLKLSQDAMGFMNMRLLAGRIVEGWNFVKQNKSPIRKLTEPACLTSFDQDFAELERLVGNSKCPIKIIRHRYAFHANVEFLLRQLKKHPPDDFIEFFGVQNGNMFFHGTDLIVLNAVIEAQNLDGDLEDLRQLQSDVMTAANALGRISRNAAAAILKKILPPDGEIERDVWDLDLPDLRKSVSPFFAFLDSDWVKGKDSSNA